MSKLSVVVVSPEKMLYEGFADEAIVPGKEGTMSILARHAPLLVTLRKGIITIINGSSQKEFDIESGFVEVSKKASSETEERNKFVNIFVRQS